MEQKKRTAVFPGTFDPFTIGHASIVERALRLFDEVVIAIGYNEHKSSHGDIEKRVESISRLYADADNVSVETYTGLTVEFASRKGAVCIVRGVRSVGDFEYERNMAEANSMLNPEIETMVLYARPELACVSSSMVRELMHNDVDVAPFLPVPKD